MEHRQDIDSFAEGACERPQRLFRAVALPLLQHRVAVPRVRRGSRVWLDARDGSRSTD